jgi:hypothetical protein
MQGCCLLTQRLTVRIPVGRTKINRVSKSISNCKSFTPLHTCIDTSAGQADRWYYSYMSNLSLSLSYLWTRLRKTKKTWTDSKIWDGWWGMSTQSYASKQLPHLAIHRNHVQVGRKGISIKNKKAGNTRNSLPWARLFHKEDYFSCNTIIDKCS